MIGAFGEPIKCYGETTRRGRRQQVRWEVYYSVQMSFIFSTEDNEQVAHFCPVFSLDFHS